MYGFVGWKFFDIDLGVNPGLSRFLVQSSFNFKVPINVTYWFRFFPTLGLGIGFGNDYSNNSKDYNNTNTDQDYGNTDKDSGNVNTVFDLSARAGLGFDFLVRKNMFLRGIFQYNLNIVPWVPACFLMRVGVGWLL